MKVTVKRTRRCWLIASSGAHLYLWLRGLCFGFQFAHRRRDGLWRHHRLRMFEPSRVAKARGTRTCEWDTWLTTRVGPGSGAPTYRVGVKAYVRLKVGFGGPVVETSEVLDSLAGAER